MTGKELGFGKAGVCSLREYSARATLRRVWKQGHTYVDLREDGKSFVFFCTLCLSPCYSDTTLFDHLKGNLHSQRYASAKLTLFGPMPWPFNDGVLFFFGLAEQEPHPHLTVQISNLNSHVDRSSNTNGHNLEQIGVVNDSNERDTIIPGVLIKDKVSILRVKFIGFGHIGLRIRVSDDCTTDGVSRIWCTWQGKEGNSDNRDMFLDVPDCEFAIITFAYTHDLGRKGVVDYSNHFLSDSSTCVQRETIMSSKKKRKKSFSDPEDISLALRNSCGSSGEDFRASKALLVEKDQAGNASTSGRYGSQIQHSVSLSSKAARRELRRQQRLASEKMCDICQQKMLPGKDVATLFNNKTGSLACSSRNINGAFHVFHTSCLIHWLLLCEFEMWADHSTNDNIGWGNTNPMPGGANRAPCSEKQMGDTRTSKTHISSVFCPECQGTGINTEGDELEKPTVTLSEMFCYKIKAISAHKSWMKDPEVLQKCSTGLNIQCGSDEDFQEKVLPLRLVQFYRADE